jgi:ribosomal protein L37AE/L43A
MLFASWSRRAILKEMHAMVVVCPDDQREDSINTEDKTWRCPDCKHVWKVAELKRRTS